EADPRAGAIRANVAHRREARQARVLAGVAGERRPADEAHAPATRAAVAGGGGVTVVARECIVQVLAADGGRRAEIGGADVLVVAATRPADAGARRAGVAHRADVAVGAGDAVVEAREAAGPRPVAGVVGADGRGGAGRAECLELAHGRAAVAVELVAVVALLTDVEDAVAADVDLLADDGEEVRLHAAGGQQRPLHAVEVGAAGAPGDR